MSNNAKKNAVPQKAAKRNAPASPKRSTASARTNSPSVKTASSGAKPRSKATSSPHNRFGIQEAVNVLSVASALVTLIDGYQKYGPLVTKAVQGLFGTSFMTTLRDVQAQSVEEQERATILLGIIAKVLRELRTAPLPDMDYSDPYVLSTLDEALSSMAQQESYEPLLPTLRIAELHQKLMKKLPPKKTTRRAKVVKV